MSVRHHISGYQSELLSLEDIIDLVFVMATKDFRTDEFPSPHFHLGQDSKISSKLNIQITVAQLSAACDSKDTALCFHHFLSFYSFRNLRTLYMWVAVSYCSLVCMACVIRCIERIQRSHVSSHKRLSYAAVVLRASISPNMKGLFITQPFTTSPISPFFFCTHTHLDRYET